MRTETQTTRTKKTLRSPVKRAAAKSSGLAKKAKTVSKTVKNAKKASSAIGKKAAPKVTKKISANKKRASNRELPEDQTEESSRTSMTEQPKMRLSRKNTNKGGANQLRERQRRESLPENHVNPASRQR